MDCTMANGGGQAGPPVIRKRRSGRWRTGIGLSVAVVSLGGTAAITAPFSSASATASSRATGSPLRVPDVTWSGCPAGQPGLTGFNCATIAVPLDYSDPGGPTISLGLVEHPATSGKPTGTLFFNPGGPDGDGSAFLPAVLSGFGTQVTSNFNIVSWDPRGAGGGLSSPAVQCFATPADETALVGPADTPPLTRSQQATWANLNAQLNQHCTGQDEALLAHVSTADSARDLDLMRQALGQRKLNYYGISYGTLLGATYANMFPGNVGKLVLDGNIDPQAWFNSGSQLSSFLRIGSDKATASTVSSFLTLCGKATEAQCAFSAGTPGATVQKFNALLERAAKAPIVTGTGQAPVSESDIVNLTDVSIDFVSAAPAIGVGGWAGLANTLQGLWTASGAPASSAPPAATAQAAAAATTAAAQASYTGLEQKLSVVCGESPNPATIAQSIAQADVSLNRAGPDAADWAWDAYCVNWPVKAASAYTGPWTKSTSPILLLNNTGDPATSIQSAQATAKLLPNAHLVTVRGYGHTVLANPSTCAENYVAGYLLSGTLPEAGATCQQDAIPFP